MLNKLVINEIILLQENKPSVIIYNNLACKTSLKQSPNCRQKKNQKLSKKKKDCPYFRLHKNSYDGFNRLIRLKTLNSIIGLFFNQQPGTQGVNANVGTQLQSFSNTISDSSLMNCNPSQRSTDG